MVSNPVGVAIANRKQQDSTSRLDKKTKSKSKKNDDPTTVTAKSSSWQVLLEGTALYIGCLILPSLLGYVYQLYLQGWSQKTNASPDTAAPSSAFGSSNSAYHMASYYYKSFSSTVCPDPKDVDPSSYIAYACPSLQSQMSSSPLYSQDTAWSDIQFISLLSAVLAICRIALVHYLVPRDYESIEALMRCKSSHLLSSDYSLSPSNSRSNLQNVLKDGDPMGWDEDDPGLRLDESERDVSKSKNKNKRIGKKMHVDGNLLSAPRFATALFRLLYTASAVALAFSSFHGADFWPWYVLGSGSTENCWDLSGGLTLGMDSDFDRCNSTLRRYFLWQASYHVHSGTFHLWSLAMLLKNPNGVPRRILSMQANSSSYIRSLAQHVLLLSLIATSYIFSSLRRLAAIGMFAFDISSCFLHLLQLCTNARENSRWRRPDVISKVYHGLVLPTYIATRFLIWPALWYSATFESEKWLRQLEQTLVPGSASLLKGVMHILMTMLMATTVVHFNRLCKHPQVRRALQN
jgi:hypothetical protein